MASAFAKRSVFFFVKKGLNQNLKLTFWIIFLFFLSSHTGLGIKWSKAQIDNNKNWKYKATLIWFKVWLSFGKQNCYLTLKFT